MSIRLYLSPRVYDGRVHNVLRDIVPHLAFEEIRNDARMLGLCLVDADDATHATLAADARVFPLCRLVVDQTELSTELARTINRNALRTALEVRGIPTDWVETGQTTRQFAAALARLFATDDAEHYRGVRPDLSARAMRLGTVIL